MLVAKWLCQNNVTRSRSGCGVWTMRYSQTAWYSVSVELREFEPRPCAASSTNSSKSCSPSPPASSRSSVGSKPCWTDDCNSSHDGQKVARRVRCAAHFKFQGWEEDG